MSNVLRLFESPSGAELMVLEKRPAAAYEAAWEWADSGLTVRVVRGSKMRTEQNLFDEFSAALQFPDYFGENWPSLDECLADLSWLHARLGYVILVIDAPKVLMDASSASLQIMVQAINKVASEWAAPVELGESWDRPAVPFHVVLQAATISEIDVRWTAAGAKLIPLDE